MANRPAMSLEFDLAGGYAALGHVQGIADAVKTDRYIGSVLKYTHARLAQIFDEETDLIAATNASAYHHVYEWRMIGLPQGRLWSHKVRGTGGKVGEGRVRESTFQFKASTHPILTPEERKGDPLGINDPMQNVPSATIAKLKPRKYMFYNKAAMMEYGLPATVLPLYGKFLFVPERRGTKGTWSLMESTQQNFTYANPQDHSGGDGTVGRFTARWVEWWKTVAPRIWDKEIARTIERDLGRSEAELKKTVRARRKTTKNIGIAVFKTEAAAFQSGKLSAEAYVFGKAKSYSSAAAYLKENVVFD